MSQAVETQGGRQPDAVADGMLQASAPASTSSAVSVAQLRAAAKVIDAYVNKTLVRARPATTSRSTGDSVAHDRIERHISQGE